MQVLSKSEGKRSIATVRLPIPENLPHKALAEGKFIAASHPQVVGKGLGRKLLNNGSAVIIKNPGCPELFDTVEILWRCSSDDFVAHSDASWIPLLPTHEAPPHTSRALPVGFGCTVGYGSFR